MTYSIRTIGLAVALSISLTACYDNDDAPAPPPVVVQPPPPPPPASIQSKFGAGFEMTFDTELNSEPSEPMDGDIIAIDLAADPEDIPEDS